MVNELKSLGVSEQAVAALPTHALAKFREGVYNLLSASKEKKVGRPKGTAKVITDLTPLDKGIIFALLRSQGNATSLSLSEELAAPMSTVQRRRQRLEESLLEQSCSLKVDKFGWGTAIIFVSINGRTIASVAEEILKMDDMVTLVTQMVGAGSMDLKVDVLFKSRPQLQSLLERIKSISNVNDIVWSEPVRVLGKNSKCYEMMLNSI